MKNVKFPPSDTESRHLKVNIYIAHSESKECFAIKIFIETEYAGFITHLHLRLHIVTLDIEALVVP
jgi:hypothetical protein